jgi:hypothetical protein
MCLLIKSMLCSSLLALFFSPPACTSHSLFNIKKSSNAQYYELEGVGWGSDDRDLFKIFKKNYFEILNDY